MNDGRHTSLSPQQIQQIQRICDRYQQAWRQGQAHSIEAAAAGAESQIRPALLQQLAELDIQCRVGRRERVDLNVYLTRWPGLDRIALQNAWDQARESDGTSILSRDSLAQDSSDDIGEWSAIPDLSCTSDEFLRRLRQSRLVPEPEIVAVLDESPPDASSSELTSKFIAAGRLTSFQANALLGGGDVPLTLGEYIIYDCVGRGGMGTVYRAMHRRMKRTVAIKVLRQDIAHAELLSKRFLREVEVAARLCHPNIVTAYDAGEQDGISYLVSEFVDGQNLSDLVKEYGPLSLPLAADIVYQAARALEYAHREGVIHRDIKPSNLLIDDAGNVKLLDVGLARLNTVEASDADHASNLTNTDVIMGTVDYMSPEQAQNTRLADEKSDVYSLGCTMWFLITGRAPYAKGTAMERLLAHREQPVPSLRQLSSLVPESLDTLLSSLMAKKPQDRIASMNELARQLDSLRTPALPDITLPLSSVDDDESDWSHPISKPPNGELMPTQVVATANVSSKSVADSPTELMPQFDDQEKDAPSAASMISGRSKSSTSFLLWVLIPGIAAAAVVAFFLRGPSEAPNTGTGRIEEPESGAVEIATLTDMSEADVRAYRTDWASSLGLPESIAVQGVTFVFIPPGDFLYGPDTIESAVNKGYYLSQSEVTVSQFRVFAKSENFQTLAERDSAGGWGQDLASTDQKRWIRDPSFNWNNAGAQFITGEHPATSLAYSDMIAFCTWMSHETGRRIRLPTEIEWEYACRCGRRGRWSFGDDPAMLHEFAWYESNAQQDMHPTQTRRPNVWGLFDMHGNEFERCQVEEHQDYDASATGPIRGGNIFSSADQTTSAFRKQSPLNTPTEGAFRIVMELE